jgi:molecular chaperone GrpE (heat shock protein)
LSPAAAWHFTALHYTACTAPTQGALSQKDSEFKEALSQKDAEFLAQLSQNMQQHQAEVAMLQEQLSQKTCDLLAHQQEIQHLQQQLEEAANKAKRAEASSAVIRYGVLPTMRLHTVC